MTTLYNKISPRREKVLRDPLFPLDIECRVHGFDDDPETIHTGHFRKLENHSCFIFQYADGTKYRLAHLDYLGNLVVVPTESNDRWEFHDYVDKRVRFVVNK